jgi:drug/metabolite transporter (DMT)-like permease
VHPSPSGPLHLPLDPPVDPASGRSSSSSPSHLPPRAPHASAAGSTAKPIRADGGDRLTDAALVLLTLIWGSNFVVVKWALDELSPLAFNALRFPVGCLVLWAVVRWNGAMPRPRPRDIPALVGLAFLGNFVYQLLFIYGLDATRAGNAALLLSTIPVWALLLAALLREGGLHLNVWTGVALTLVGMGVMVGGGTQALGIEGTSLRGDLFMVLAAMSWAGYTVGARPLILRYGTLPVTAWTLWGGSLALVAVGLPDVLSTDLRTVGAGAWAAVLFAGAFALGIAYLIWYRAVRRMGSARTAAFSNLIPVVGLVLAWAVLDEALGWIQLVGAGIILAGIVLVRWGGGWTPGRSREAAPSGPPARAAGPVVPQPPRRPRRSSRP